MATTHRSEAFQRDDLERIGVAMDHLASSDSRAVWVNIEPDIDRNEVPEGSPFFRIFSSRGPIVPVGTWVPVRGERRETHHHEVGVAHGTGEKAAARLARLGVRTPLGWHVTQDHKKRGLIYAMPTSQSALVAVRFLCDAVNALSPFDFDEIFVARFSEQ